ncbi:MAG TPA: bifunctional phosphopantothenoylcysteine decarboxylase/phosphopantothenate--cysteine ligase CoaBC [Thermodesulfobacteriota bacterium]|nr:bifunctional phosphopantothenoylcysteine decarboxylase/phosphopantothenate--cysteine ligase CoaBC [Thermodesulfobacteriota bacterium]
MSRISGKNIVLGVTGGIAAYKACELVRRLMREGASVQVVMTKNAAQFVSPLTFQTLSGKRVAMKTFDLEWESEIGHISLADRADLVVIAPATAAFIGKAASGMADNLLTTVLLATRATVMICPAMNVNMYSNPVVQENMEKLKRRGFVLVEPDEGDLACGWEGKGRLPEVGRIMEEIERLLSPKDLSGERVLVTAGATREFIDSIRFISNPSSGKMGYALARAGWMRGADVLLISAKTDVEPPSGVSLINVVTVSEMHEAVMSNLGWSSVVIKAAAVGDYRPVETFPGKLKKNSKEIHLKLERTLDILLDVGKNKNGRIVVGFAAEGENVVENALGKLRKKNADLIVANDIHRPGAGFGQDTNIVCFVDRWGKVEELPLMTKAEIADKIFDKILEFRKGNPIQGGR